MTRSRTRGGRPPQSEAGQVEARLLEAAEELILSQGFARTTMEQVAARARAGKTTLYSRFPTKSDLYIAVVRHTVARDTASITNVSATGSIQDRLVDAGLQLADLTLTPSSIALMRVTAAEARAFPALALEGHRIGFGLCVEAIARCLRGNSAVDDIDEAAHLARRFVELALHPLYNHAMVGHPLPELLERARTDVAQVADYLLSTSHDPRRSSPRIESEDHVPHEA